MKSAAASAPKTVTTASKPARKQVKTPAAKSPSLPTAKPVESLLVKTTDSKSTKAKKPKLVRDSFTFPKDEYAVLEALKLRASKLGSPVKKTELLRAGLKALAALPDAKFIAALQAVPSLKTGRPAKHPAD